MNYISGNKISSIDGIDHSQGMYNTYESHNIFIQYELNDINSNSNTKSDIHKLHISLQPSDYERVKSIVVEILQNSNWPLFKLTNTDAIEKEKEKILEKLKIIKPQTVVSSYLQFIDSILSTLSVDPENVYTEEIKQVSALLNDLKQMPDANRSSLDQFPSILSVVDPSFTNKIKEVLAKIHDSILKPGSFMALKYQNPSLFVLDENPFIGKITKALKMLDNLKKNTETLRFSQGQYNFWMRELQASERFCKGDQFTIYIPEKCSSEHVFNLCMRIENALKDCLPGKSSPATSPLTAHISFRQDRLTKGGHYYSAMPENKTAESALCSLKSIQENSTLYSDLKGKISLQNKLEPIKLINENTLLETIISENGTLAEKISNYKNYCDEYIKHLQQTSCGPFRVLYHQKITEKKISIISEAIKILKRLPTKPDSHSPDSKKIDLSEPFISDEIMKTRGKINNFNKINQTLQKNIDDFHRILKTRTDDPDPSNVRNNGTMNSRVSINTADPENVSLMNTVEKGRIHSQNSEPLLSVRRDALLLTVLKCALMILTCGLLYHYLFHKKNTKGWNLLMTIGLTSSKR